MRFAGNPTPLTPDQKLALREHAIRARSHTFIDGVCIRCKHVNDGWELMPECSREPQREDHG